MQKKPKQAKKPKGDTEYVIAVANGVVVLTMPETVSKADAAMVAKRIQVILFNAME